MRGINMTVKQLLASINELQLLTNGDTNKEVSGVYIGDLLSFVMSHASEGDCWLTVQTHLNVIAIATLLELAAVIVVEDSEIEEETIIKANEEGIIVLKTNLTAYDLAIKINQLLNHA